MANVTIYGGRSAKYLKRAPKRQKAPGRLRRFLTGLLAVLLILECFYFYLCYTDNGFISKWRTTYISTALSTMRHQWLATALLPEKIVQQVADQMQAAKEEQIGNNSSWDLDNSQVGKPPAEEVVVDDTDYWVQQDPDGAQAFFDLFWEIDQQSMFDYLDEHPEAIANGWENINIDESALDADGTSIQTTLGEQILAINAKDGILLIRVTGSTFRGILAIGKYPEQLSMRYSAGIGSYGQTCKTICEQNGAILGISASGFLDPGGVGNGGLLAGYAMCDGEARGYHMAWGNKRTELREDNRLYIVDSQDPVHPDTTDAVEFTPALIVDGEIVVDNTTIWTDLNPRAIIGQSNRGEIMMLVIEGRMASSLGVSVVPCADLLAEHGCVQAMNLDGGTTAIMYYNGKTVTRCSNSDLPDGRTLPNAFTYFPKD